jgi:Holliday junction resolvase RusA-like endonuclease
VKLVLNINPVPASRPRVARTGRVFYAKTYNRFRHAAKRLVPEEIKKAKLKDCPIEGPVALTIRCLVVRPKRTVLQFPKPDTDNYAKAVMDALNGQLFVDDQQVVQLLVLKQWAEPGEPGRIELEIERHEPSQADS